MADVEWFHLRAADLRELQERDAIVIVPVGALEQHGPHLPVQTDMKLVAEVARRTAEIVTRKEPIVVTPVVWTGLSEHHMHLGGTITLDHNTFIDLIRAVGRSLARLGFRRILFLNGHGGNIMGLRMAVDQLTLEHRLPFCVCQYWQADEEAYRLILERQPSVRHAGEAETSMMLSVCPELVDQERLADAKGPTWPELSDKVGSAVYRWRSYRYRTETGVIGDAELATAEKGERLLSASSEALARMLVNPDLWEMPI